MRIMGIHPTGPAVKNDISSELARESIAIFPDTYHFWFLVYQRVPLQRPHLLPHLHPKIPYLMSTDTPKIQYWKEVEVRVKSFGETHCVNPQKPNTKNEEREEVQEIHRMNCLIGCRNSERLCLMKERQQSLGETQSKDVKTLPSHLMNFQ